MVCKYRMKSFLTFILLMTFFALPVYPDDVQEGRTFWIDRFMSVSYPLKTVKVTSSYGTRKDPFTGERSSHSGLDLKADNESVMAMFDGVVEDYGYDPTIVDRLRAEGVDPKEMKNMTQMNAEAQLAELDQQKQQQRGLTMG